MTRDAHDLIRIAAARRTAEITGRRAPLRRVYETIAREREGLQRKPSNIHPPVGATADTPARRGGDVERSGQT
jgi:hypothetical protein